MSYVTGKDRSQTTMFPESLDDFVPRDSYVRFLDKFVDSFDMKELGFKHSVPAETGRPPYDPRDLLKLYLLGFMNRITSSRQLAYACRANVEALWLLRRVQPDFRTISDFRKGNGKAIRRFFRSFIQQLKKLGIVRGELVGIDGTKFRAVNSKDNNYSEKKLNSLIARYNSQIAGYLRRLDRNDVREEDHPQLKEQLEQQVELLEERKREKLNLLKDLRESGEKQVSTVDPESRRMKCGDGTVVGYNVQATVDAEHKLIIDVEVTNEGNDCHQLYTMASRAKEILKQATLKAAADTGYYQAEELVKCEKEGIETFVSKPRTGQKALFGKPDFLYFKDQDYYLCPAGERLPFKGKIREHGRWLLRYQGNACGHCPIRSKCTSRKQGNRRITRFIEEGLLDNVEERTSRTPHIRKLRKSIVEHPFGTLKRWMAGRFLTRGKIKAATEIVIAVVAYDIKRLVKIVQDPSWSGSSAFGRLLQEVTLRAHSCFWRLRYLELCIA